MSKQWHDFEKNDRVQITSAGYGPLTGATGRVFDNGEHGSEFLVQIDGFKVVINDPATDLVLVGPTLAQLIYSATELQEAAGRFGEVKIDSNRISLRIGVKLFRSLFTDFSYQVYKSGVSSLSPSVYLEAEDHLIRFSAYAGNSPEVVAEAQAWLATQDDDAEVPVTEGATA